MSSTPNATPAVQRLALALLVAGLASCGGGGSTSSPVTDAITPPLGTAPAPPPAPPITTVLGVPSRMLGGLGAGNPIAEMTKQQIRPDIIDTYLVGVGGASWPTWNSPDGAYVTHVSANVPAAGAVPETLDQAVASDATDALTRELDADHKGKVTRIVQPIA